VHQYETMYILKSDLEAEQTSTLVSKYQSLVTEHGGEISKLEEMGKRRLAYEINHNRDGYYVLMEYSADTDFTRELERQMRIDDSVIRFLTVRVGE
jgi:small subunit ribosomal protein S6